MREGWKLKPLGDLVRIASGQVDPKDTEIARNLSVGPDNLRSGGGLERKGIKTAGELEQISGKYAFDSNAILYSKIRPNLNKIALVDFDGICSADMYPIWVRDDCQAAREFIFYVMNSERFVADATSRSFRTGLPKINRLDLESIEVPFPPLSEQRKIAEILRTWDDAIEKLEALRAAKEARLHNFYNIVFQPNSKINSNWDQFKIGEFVELVSERSLPSIDLPLYSLTIENGITPKSDRYDREFLVKNQETKLYKVVKPNDIVFNPANLRWGAIAQSTEHKDVLVSPIYEVLRHKPGTINIEFLVHALTCPYQIRRFSTKVEGTLVERMAVKADAFCLTSIVVPKSKIEQERLAEIMDEAKREMLLLKRQISALTHQKRGLMQKLLTGEWRVKDDVQKESI